MAGRFIKLYDKILNWQWFDHPHTLCLFVYLLLKANYKDMTFKGMTVRRGQLVTSLPKMATDVGLTIQQTRTALMHLISTGEVTDESTTQYRIITVVKYDDFQKATDKSTESQQTINRRYNKQSTDDSTPSIEYIEHIEKNRTIEPSYEGESAKRFTPPTANEVFDYCVDNGYGIDVDRFMAYYNSNGWKVGRNPMKDWRAAVQSWYRRDKQEYSNRPQERPAQRLPAQEYHQRDYSDAQEAAFERMMALGGEDL